MLDKLAPLVLARGDAEDKYFNEDSPGRSVIRSR